MAFEPIGRHLERDVENPLRHRLHAAPIALQFDGITWQRIEKLVTQAGGGYDVRIPGQEAVIHYRPAKRPVGARQAAVVTGTHLGDVVNLAAVDDVVQYTVETEGQVERTEAGPGGPPLWGPKGIVGWKLGTVSGVDVGLFFGDWMQKFKEKFTQATDGATGITTLSLDLTQYKAQAEPGLALGTPGGPPRGATLNLDPTDIFAYPTYNYHFEDDTGEMSWHELHAAPQGDAYAINGLINVFNPESSYSVIERSVMRFAIPSEAAVVTSAILIVPFSDMANFCGAHAGRAKGSTYNFGTLSNGTVYAAIHSGCDDWKPENQGEGILTFDVASSWVAEMAGKSVDYALLLDDDYTDAEPIDAGIRYLSSYDAYIEYELPSPSAFFGHHAVGRGVGNGVHMGIG